MRRSPSIVPAAADRDAYLVLDDFGELGRSWRETDEAHANRDSVITDLLQGQYSWPCKSSPSTPLKAGRVTFRRKSPTSSCSALPARSTLFRSRFRTSSIATAAAGRRSCHCRCEALPDMPMEFYKGRPLEPARARRHPLADRRIRHHRGRRSRNARDRRAKLAAPGGEATARRRRRVNVLAMPRKPLEIPPAAARAFAKDMRAFHAAKTGFDKDEIAARQLHALREHLRPGEKIRLTDVHELFLAMKDHA